MQNEAILHIVSIVYLTLLYGKSWNSNFNVTKFEQFIGEETQTSEGGLIKDTQKQTDKTAETITKVLGVIAENKKDRKKLQMEFDSSLSQLNSDEFIMDHESYIRLQARNPQAILVQNPISEIVTPTNQSLMQKFPLFVMDDLSRIQGTYE